MCPILCSKNQSHEIVGLNDFDNNGTIEQITTSANFEGKGLSHHQKEGAYDSNG